MKPLHLELQAFGPFVDKQSVDFEKLSRSGMFLIKGKTGSGKTTIFDAMTFALYGGSSGDNDKSKNGRNDLEEWRCTQADNDTPTVVSFTFSVHGRRYVFTRSLIPKRVNLSPKYEAGEIDEDGNVIPFFNNPKKDDLTKKAEELIGLTKEQFRQVVLLPQGQFERFLTASSSEKESILQKIFNSVQWGKYAQNFFNAAYERKSALDGEETYIKQALSDEGFEDITELDEHIQSLRQQKTDAVKKYETFNSKQRQAELSADIQLAEQFKALHTLEEKLESLKKRADEIESKRLAYAQAEKAEFLREYIAEFERCEESRNKRENALRSKIAELPKKERAATEAAEAKRIHDEASPVADLQKKLGEYESKIPVYASVEQLKGDYDKALNDCDNTQTAFNAAVVALENATEECSQLFAEYQDAESLSHDYRSRYFTGIYGELASALIDGECCPVCGSKTHPQPAEKSTDSVSKPALDKQEKNSAKAKKVWEKAEKERQKAEQAKNSVEAVFKEKTELKNTADAELKAAEKSLIDGIADSDALSFVIDDCNTKISAFEKESESLKEKLDNAVRTCEDLRSQINIANGEMTNAETAFENAKASLEAALAEKGYDDYRSAKAQLISAETRLQMQKQTVEYDTDMRSTEDDIAAARKELKGKTEPDAEAFTRRQAEIDSENERFTKLNAELDSSIERLSIKRSDLSRLEDHYHNEILQAENDLAFAKKLRGDTGIGLQRYVLAITFNQVIGEANQMLSKVHGGRYLLFRSDDKGSGNKRGLELKVHDSRSPENEKGRSVSMLSGGEKFLVSLALSIGMSTVAQKSGVQIEALFIDEGFGTLDDSSIDDAMDILEGVRKGNGTIGIISHIPLLESAITTKLEVVSSEEGSQIKAL